MTGVCLTFFRFYIITSSKVCGLRISRNVKMTETGGLVMDFLNKWEVKSKEGRVRSQEKVVES